MSLLEENNHDSNLKKLNKGLKKLAIFNEDKALSQRGSMVP
jgi:hypothetical protein